MAGAFDLAAELEAALRREGASIDVLLTRADVDAVVRLARDTLMRQLASVPRPQRHVAMTAAAAGWFAAVHACLVEARRGCMTPSDAVH